MPERYMECIKDDANELGKMVHGLQCKIGQQEDEIIDLQNQVEHWQEELNRANERAHWAENMVEERNRTIEGLRNMAV